MIVTHNSAGHVGKCVASIAAAAGGLSHEILVIDSGSSDDSLSLATAAAPAVRTHALGENRGYAAALNAGAARARGRWLAFGNADLGLSPGCLERLCEAVRLDPAASAAGPLLLSDSGEVLPSARGLPRLAHELLHATKAFRLWPGNPLCKRIDRRDLGSGRSGTAEFLVGALFVTDRERLERIGPFDESYFLYFEETEWFSRACALGLHALFVAEAEAVHRGGGSSRPEEEMIPVYLRSQYRFHRRTMPGWRVALLQAACCIANIGRWATRPLAPDPGAAASRGRIAAAASHLGWLARATFSSRGAGCDGAGRAG